MRSSGPRSSVNRVASAYGVILDAIRIATNVALVVLVVVVLAAVAVRYLGIFRGSLHWATEYSRFAIVWIAMLGSAVALDKGAHVAIDFTEQLPAAMRAKRARRPASSLARCFSPCWPGRVFGSRSRPCSRSRRRSGCRWAMPIWRFRSARRS